MNSSCLSPALYVCWSLPRAQLKLHPFFADIDWSLLAEKKVVPPFKPNVHKVTDTDNFDVEFTSMPLHSHEANKLDAVERPTYTQQSPPTSTAGLHQQQQPQPPTSRADGALSASGGSGEHGEAVVVDAAIDDEEDDEVYADGDSGQFANFTFVSHDYL